MAPRAVRAIYNFPFRIKSLAMPIYAYRCAACGHSRDVLQKISDPVLTTCPVCNAEQFQKQVTAAGFQLKGSGWYATDFRNGGTAAPAAGPVAPPVAGGDSAAAPAAAPASAPSGDSGGGASASSGGSCGTGCACH